MVVSIKNQLLVRTDIRYKKVLPDFSTGRSKILMPSVREGRLKFGSYYDTACKKAQEITTGLFGELFGGENVILEFSLEEMEDFNNYSNPQSKVVGTTVSFPNILLSSISVFSIWLNFIRKPLWLAKEISARGALANTLDKDIKYINDTDFSNWNTMRKEAVRMSKSVGDAFYKDKGYLSQSSGLTAIFPMDAYEVNLSRLNDGMSSILNSKSWFYPGLISGYRTHCQKFFERNIPFRKQFLSLIEKQGKIDKQLYDEFMREKYTGLFYVQYGKIVRSNRLTIRV